MRIRQWSISFGVLILITLCLAGKAKSSIDWNALRAEASKGLLLDVPYSKCFEQAAQKYNLPMMLLLSVAKGESNFNPKAVSDKDAIGIMQVKWPETAKDLGFDKKSELFEPCPNILAGASYLKQMLDRYNGNIQLALAAYFSGPNSVEPGSVPDSGKDYARYIHSRMAILKKGIARRKYYVRIMAYDMYFYAENMLNYLKEKLTNVPFEITKNSLNNYIVNIVANDPKKKQSYVKKVKGATGLDF